MRRPQLRTLFAIAAWLAALVLAVVSLVLLALGSSGIASDNSPRWLVAMLYLANLSLPTVGALVTLRRPGNPIGPLLLVAGLSVFAWVSSSGYATYALAIRPDLPGGVIALWLSGWTPLSYAFALLAFVPLLYPDGRFLSQRWRVIGWLAGALVVVQSVGVAFGRPVLQSGTSVGTTSPNPLAVAGLAPIDALFTRTLGVPLGFAFLAISWAAVVIRFRRSRGVERLQIKWFLYAVGVVVVAFATLFPLAFVGNVISSDIFFFTFMFTFTLIPLSIGVAILRYRLYDIDQLINRTLVYGVTTGAIAVTFFGGMIVLPTLLRPIISGSEVAVAVSTLVCFALFQPLRSRVQDAVDRRFYRSRYDAARTLDAFSLRLRDEVDLDAVRGELLDAVGSTLSPTHASVWLRGRRAR
jgi:hypothetical protein